MKTEVVVSLVLVAFAAGSTRAEATPRVQWWLNGRVQRHLELSNDQVRALDAIYSNSLPGRRALRERLDRAHVELDRAIQQADDARAMALAVRLADAQSARDKARTLMVWRMYKVLLPAQRRQLPTISHVLGQFNSSDGM